MRRTSGESGLTPPPPPNADAQNARISMLRVLIHRELAPVHTEGGY